MRRGLIKGRVILPFLIGMAIMITGCSKSNENVAIVESVQSLVSYDTEDTYTEWDEQDATTITFNDQSIDIEDNNSVLINDNTVEIHTSGTYVLEGSSTDSQVIVDAEDEGTVRLILNGVSLESTSTAPIFVKQADKAVISAVDGTSNTITDPSEYVYEEETDEPKAAIYSKDDLTVNGTGTLIVNGNYKDGITGKDDLKIIEATIEVTAEDDGIVGRDLFAMNDAFITIDAGGDGVKSSNDTDENKANMVLERGSLAIDAGSDGIQSENTVTIVDGEYTITAGGGSPETIEATTEFGGGFGGQGQGTMPNGEEFSEGNMPQGKPDFAEGEEPPEQGEMGGFENRQPPEQAQEREQEQDNTEETEETEEDDTTSTKGIKAENKLDIVGGSLTIDANDDALHSNNDMVVAGGEITLSTGDDALHADNEMTISDGSIQIEKSYEGIEGKSITVSGGDIHVTAEDDGINVNGGTDQMAMQSFGESQTENAEESVEEEQESDEGKLLIEGGSIYIDANGDGLDSNTSAAMTGGTVLVYGPTNSGNGALDYDESFEMEGGTLLATGSSGMAEGVSESSKQSTFMMTFPETLEAGTTVYVEDSNEDAVAAVAPEKAFQSIVISSPDLKQDESYTIYTNGELSGDEVDGFYQNVTTEGGTKVLEFSLTSTMMYLNESGETEQSSGMFGGGRGQRGQGGS
ncbi:carbohydrate-binding domain-containing protein [Oceanobacillus picturae]|uniref:carbohydrate-binding domain-containing protein n=1 Tax=Oceanobacillus picturae TaxID=171693 RepID=UPI000E6A8A35|nr:carbohydrate-binding domain-containing protein [Oceanobacillus picturae]RIU88517.1 carbohydrate-binding domain-containing protein [Oceanobacillus picturae]